MCLIFFYKNTILKKIFCIENRQRGDAKPDRASEFFVLPLYLIRRRPHVLHPVRRLQRVLTLRGQDLADGCKQVSKVRRLDLKYLRIGFLFKHYSHQMQVAVTVIVGQVALQIIERFSNYLQCNCLAQVAAFKAHSHYRNSAATSK